MYKLIFLWCLLPTLSLAHELKVESSLVNFSNNDIRITGKDGSNLNMQDFDQKNTFGYRIYYTHQMENSFIRILYAPLQTSFSGNFDTSKNFDGTLFSSGPAQVNYKFNSYRLTYGREFFQDEKWTLNWGLVGKIRDAFIEVEQNGVSKKNSNIGFVPLLHFSGDYKLSDNSKFVFDIEALAAPQGRAIDAGLFLSHQISPQADILYGYRVVEGGADNEKVYNFSLINFYTLGLNWRF
jgi:hypothetical protein